MAVNPVRRLYCRYRGSGIILQLRVVSPMKQAGGAYQAKSAELNGSSTVSREPPDSDTLSRDGGDALSSVDEAPTPTAAWAAAGHLR